jgi:glycosyltransferase involved in cell wall biosynthesis
MKVSENQCLFSIVIPTYNRAHLISRAIDSVVNQTYKNWELIIVDDGSTDNTKELVENYYRKDNRIRYVYQENAERSAARNNGIEHASGEFICFLDSDDYYFPNRLQTLYESVKESNIVYYTGLVLEKEKSLQKRTEIPVNGIKKLDELCLATIHSQQVCIPSSIAKKYKYDVQFRVGEDLELWLRVNNEYPFQYIENAFQIVLVDHNERTVSIKNNTGKEQLDLYNYIFSSKHDGRSISKSIKNTLISNCYYTIFRYWFYHQNRLKCLKFMVACILSNFQSEQLKFRINILVRLMGLQSFEKINKIID